MSGCSCGLRHLTSTSVGHLSYMARHQDSNTHLPKTDRRCTGSKSLMIGSIVLSGMEIGNNAIIRAGSVVTKDMPAGSFVGGNPTRNVSGLIHKAWESTDTKDKMRVAKEV